MKHNQTIFIDKTLARPVLDTSLFENISYAYDYPLTHQGIFERLKNAQLYTITVIIDNLNPHLYRYEKYAEKIEIPILSKYRELLYEYFFNEYDGDRWKANEVYAKFLDDYRSIWQQEGMKKDLDDYIIRGELEPRYKKKILKKFGNLKQLDTPRVRIERKRHYNLPQPLNRVDWRNPYDTIFVWEDKGNRFCVRGGSGSSGQRERNSLFVYGFSLINKVRPISSHLYLYNNKNELLHLKNFPSLTVPGNDIGCNYDIPKKEDIILKTTDLIHWNIF